MSRSCVASMTSGAGNDKWLISHVILPFGLVAILRLDPTLTMLLVYVFETIEAGLLAGCSASISEAIDETVFESLVLDPLAGACGVLTAVMLSRWRLRWTRAETAQHAWWRLVVAAVLVLVVPSLALWIPGVPRPELVFMGIAAFTYALATLAAMKLEPWPSWWLAVAVSSYVLLVGLVTGLVPFNRHTTNLVLHASLWLVIVVIVVVVHAPVPCKSARHKHS